MGNCIMMGNNKKKPQVIIEEWEFVKGGESVLLTSSKRYRVIVSVYGSQGAAANYLYEYCEAYIENTEITEEKYKESSNGSQSFINFEAVDTYSGLIAFCPFGTESTLIYRGYKVSINIFEI